MNDFPEIAQREEIDFLIFHASVLESQVHRENGSSFRNNIILKVKNLNT